MTITTICDLIFYAYKFWRPRRGKENPNCFKFYPLQPKLNLHKLHMLKLPCNPTLNLEINEEKKIIINLNIRTYEKNTKYNKTKQCAYEKTHKTNSK